MARAVVFASNLTRQPVQAVREQPCVRQGDAVVC